MAANGWHRKTPNTPATQARRREYNSRTYRQAKAAGQHLVDTGQAHCWRCGKWLPPHQPWHLGHDDHDRTIIRGPECPPCNLTAAARAGNRTRNRIQTHAAARRSTHSRRW